MTKSGFDSVAMTVLGWQQLVPPNPQVIGAYANGIFANSQSAFQAFPHAIHYTYDVNGSRPDADVLDIERFDAVPSQAPGWFHAWQLYKHPLPKPAFYTSASNVQTVINTLSAAGIGRDQYLILSAHYEDIGLRGEHICGPSTCRFPQADATQWDDHGANGQNTDRLLYKDSFFLSPVVRPHGQAHLLVTFDLGTGAWTKHSLPGSVHWGALPRRASVELQLETGGPHAGEWREQSLPWNAPPLL